jgi:V/A-type H+-transporting ATPase subunit D
MQQRQRNATKAELVRLRQQMHLAVEGMDLLEKKRDQLMKQALALLKKAKALRLDVTERWLSIQNAWDEALSHENSSHLKSLADTVAESPGLETDFRHWMGAVLTDIAWPDTAIGLLGSATECDLRTERVRGMAHSLLPDLIRLMAIESNIRRITAALKRCQRQVNGLEHAVIPELKSDQHRIEQRLEETEREALFQIKRLKGRAL